MPRRTAVPRPIAQAPLRTVRPRDAEGVYREPRPQFARLAKAGALLRLANGYYIVVPDDRGPDWRPGVEAAAAGVATSIYGQNQAILMGVSAARVHGAIPRALAVATVAVPKQHRPIKLDGLGGAHVHFVMRNVDNLDARQERLDVLGRGLVTTPEQTVLDLARSPHVGGQDQIVEALRNLAPRCDPAILEEIADQQRLRSALRRFQKIVA